MRPAVTASFGKEEAKRKARLLKKSGCISPAACNYGKNRHWLTFSRQLLLWPLPKLEEETVLTHHMPQVFPSIIYLCCATKHDFLLTHLKPQEEEEKGEGKREEEGPHKDHRVQLSEPFRADHKLKRVTEGIVQMSLEH